MVSSRPSDLADSMHADDRWLRELARRLLRDASAAEDAAQATWESVLRSPPREGAVTRGFLATALRHVISKLRRTDARREVREQHSASQESASREIGPLDDVIEKMEFRREMLAAVLALEPAYRDVILLRFHADLTPTAIAERLALPVATVKTRLRRAQDQLAERLGREDPQRFFAALVATAEPTLATAITTVLKGGLVMAVKSKLVAAGCAAVLVVGGFALFDQEPEPPAIAQSAPAPTAERAVESPPRLAQPPTAAPTAREAAEVSVAEHSATETAAPENPTTTPIDGFVFDALGHPLGSVALEFRAGMVGRGRIDGKRGADVVIEQRMVSESDGRFRVDLGVGRSGTTPSGTVHSADPGLATLYTGVVQSTPRSVPPVVVVAPGIALGGTIVDAEGKPVPSALVTCDVPDSAQVAPPLPLENSQQLFFSTSCGADGAFAFDRPAPACLGTRLVVRAPGFLSFTMPIPERDDQALRIVLERPSPEAPNRVRGQVIDAFGAPVAKAKVVLGFATAETDPRGLFDLDSTQARSAQELRACALGSLPGAVAWPLAPARDFVTIQLGPPPLAIGGKIRRPDGTPVAGAIVDLNDATVLGFAGSNGEIVFDEECAGGHLHGARTDAVGAFELGGLRPRPYTLRVLDLETGANFLTAPIPAGVLTAAIEVPGDLLLPQLRGKVVDRAGRGIPGISVQVAVRSWHRKFLDTASSATGSCGAPTVTHDGGSFLLRDVPRTDAMISVSGDAIVSTAVPLPSEPGADFEIVVDRRRYLRIELGAGETATAFKAVDARGDTIELRHEESTSITIADVLDLNGGKSGVVMVSELATAIVLLEGTRELRRVPIEFHGDEILVIR